MIPIKHPLPCTLPGAGFLGTGTGRTKHEHQTKIMKTKSYHISNLGSFAPSSATVENGYVTYHDSPRYRNATEDQLNEWSGVRTKAVRNAAVTEIAERALRVWQKS